MPFSRMSCATPVRPPNLARFAFLDPRSRALWVDWEKAAWDTVAILRAEAGRNPYDRTLSDLIGQLSTRSEEFRERWAAHDVKFHRTAPSSSTIPWWVTCLSRSSRSNF